MGSGQRHGWVIVIPVNDTARGVAAHKSPLAASRGELDYRLCFDRRNAAEYTHVVLGLIYLKQISDAFEAKHADLERQKFEGADSEDRDEFRAANIFSVRKEALWSHLKTSAPQPTLDTLGDDAMAAIERSNPTLKGAGNRCRLLALCC
jgi:type I restriction-modification system DNA methylase subunit